MSPSRNEFRDVVATLSGTGIIRQLVIVAGSLVYEVTSTLVNVSFT